MAAAPAQDADFRILVKHAEQQVRLGFVRKVYGILTMQLLLTVAIAAPLSLKQEFIAGNRWLLWLSTAMTLVTICAMSCCQSLTRKFPTNYICVFVFTAFEGVCIGFVSSQYSWQSVVLAASMTIGIFVCMTTYACLTKTDFTGMGPYLFAGLMALLMFGLVLSILTLLGINLRWALMAYNIIGVLIFTFFIVFDTQRILGQYGGHQIEFSIDDYVFASLNLYLDIINLFVFLLSLLGDRQ